MSIFKTTLENLGRELNISPARYESAEKSYKSIGEWLRRPDSRLAQYNLRVYLQGSFCLGTPIRPIDGEEQYDLDMVCEVDLAKHELTQERFQTLVGLDLVDYAERFGMESPERWDRCWTLNYSEGARFKIDFLPAIPDGQHQSGLFRQVGILQSSYIELSVAIADRKHRNFRSVSREWPVSNPNGYAKWFIDQMNRHQTLDERVRLQKSVEIADVPVYKRRTPLQIAVQILKRHRDLMFRDDLELKPSSVILTTLSGLAYGGESTIDDAIVGIISRMENHIVKDTNGDLVIANPSDRRENFADAWIENPKKAENFFDWLRAAQFDFQEARNGTAINQVVDALSRRLGRTLVEDAAPKLVAKPLSLLSPRSALTAVIADAPHRRAPKWPVRPHYNAKIARVTLSRDGFKPRLISSEEQVARRAKLDFELETDVPGSFQVYWQVVNTGDGARQAGDLRGGFDTNEFYPGTLQRREGTKYPGIHSIQGFIVKDGVCIAISAPFVVKIADT